MRALLLTLFLISSSAFAMPALEGIAKLSNCSGALVIFDGMPTTARALVVTQAQCLTGRQPRPGAVFTNRLAIRALNLIDASGKAHAVTTRRLLYATQTDTDLAVYELGDSYNEVQFKTSIRPLFLTAAPPILGQNLELISAHGPRRWSCAVEGFVREVRDERRRFTDVIQLSDECRIDAAVPAGIPAVDLATRTLFALHGKQRLTQQVYALAGCVDQNFEVDLELASCELPK